MPIHARDKQGVVQLDVVQTEPIWLVIELFKIHGCVDVFGSSNGRRLVDLISEQVEQVLHYGSAHDTIRFGL